MQKLVKVLLVTTAIAISAVPMSYAQNANAQAGAAQSGSLSAEDQALFDALALPPGQARAFLALSSAQRAEILAAVAQIRADVLTGVLPEAALGRLSAALAATGNRGLAGALSTAVAINLAELADSTPPGSPARRVVVDAVGGVALIAANNGVALEVLTRVRQAVANVAAGQGLDRAIAAVSRAASGVNQN